MSNWPKVGDSILARGADWETEALLSASFDWFISYAISYKTAADVVVESVEARRSPPDSVGYAVLFLYRHYIEIMLKGLINIGNMLQSRKGGFPTGTHGIQNLWRQCRPLLEAAYPAGEKTDTDAVEKVLLEIHVLDPSSESFRFGEKKDGNPTLPNGTQINLANLRDVMNRLDGFLSGSYDWVYELLQYQADIDSDSY